MWNISIDDPVSVSQSVTRLFPARTAKQIDIPFQVETLEGLQNTIRWGHNQPLYCPSCLANRSC